MATIPQRDLRNDIAGVLRRAEAGETIVVTVSGREVAQLGPVQRARFVSGDQARAAFSVLPRLTGLLDDLGEAAGGVVDPWA